MDVTDSHAIFRKIAGTLYALSFADGGEILSFYDMVDAVSNTLEDPEGLKALGLTDLDQEAIEGCHDFCRRVNEYGAHVQVNFDLRVEVLDGKARH